MNLVPLTKLGQLFALLVEASLLIRCLPSASIFISRKEKIEDATQKVEKELSA